MKKYVIIDKTTGNVKSIMEWADIPIPTIVIEDGVEKEIINHQEVEFPSNWVFNENEEAVTCDGCCDVELGDVYDHNCNMFYILDITDEEIEISELKYQLSQLERELTSFQEATWSALMIDETKLPQIWQDRLFEKRRIRARLSELGVVINQ